jgi:hypothetical protein
MALARRGFNVTASDGSAGVVAEARLLKRIQSDSGEGRTFTREALAEAWGISE